MIGGREAFKWAIENSRFELAEKEARSLFDLDIAAAQLEETAGEQWLATVEASLELQERLSEISDAEQKILDDIKEADMASAKELLRAREELEKINAREEARANEAIGGAQARLITGSQFGPQYTQALNNLRAETDSLRAGAALLPPGQRAAQLAHIDAFEQARIDQINQQFLSHPLVTPDPLSTTARGGAGTTQGRTTIINVSVGGHVTTEQDLADFIFDTIKTGEESGVLLSG